LALQIAACGMHLSAEYGNTGREILRDGFRLDRKVIFPLDTDNELGTVRSVGLGCAAFGSAFSGLAPDAVVVLGDRSEILAAATAALFLKIPIAHIHGGESTVGALDESVRHAVTKMATWHFPAAEAYRKRIVQMGEDPSRVFCCGAPGLDAVHALKPLSRDELGRKLGMDLSGPFALCTLHPETASADDSDRRIRTLLGELGRLPHSLVFTKANSDMYGRVINRRIAAFCALHPDKRRLFDSLGTAGYLSAMRYADLMIGNSSSGIIEASSFGLPVVNLGRRQEGRLKPRNVIDCGISASEIRAALAKALKPGFRDGLRGLVNPYSLRKDGRNSRRIKEILKRVTRSPVPSAKVFFDIRHGW
jgi:UDP-N-acetylglucosamine 2-epimerase (non-hydrolysing)/GDP/UDP-N,N'-diacetylbacillosamine 2-epimerase (hydrolysing)